MYNINSYIYSAIIISTFLVNFCSNELEFFNFNPQKLDSEERDKLFSYIDLNKDLNVIPNEFRLLLKLLFNLNNSYIIDKNIEQKLFNLTDLNKNNQINKEEYNQLWNKWIKVILNPKSALIVVDMQNDFIASTGSMTIKNAVNIVPVINKLIATVNFDTIVYTYDWHPSNHCSFVENINLRNLSDKSPKYMNIKTGDSVTFEGQNIAQILWPKHCVQNTEGAKLYADLIVANNSFKAYKGINPEIDSYSAFFDNGHQYKYKLGDRLNEKGITDVYLTGVVYEYCVGYTAADALQLGFRTAFIEDAIHSIKPEDKEKTRSHLMQSFVSLIEAKDVKDMVDAKVRKLEMGIVLAEKLLNKK